MDPTSPTLGTTGGGIAGRGIPDLGDWSGPLRLGELGGKVALFLGLAGSLAPAWLGEAKLDRARDVLGDLE